MWTSSDLQYHLLWLLVSSDSADLPHLCHCNGCSLSVWMEYDGMVGKLEREVLGFCWDI